MSQHVGKCRAGLAMFVALALIGTAADCAPLSVRALGAEQLRLSSIDYRMGAANRGACLHPQMLSGLVLHDLTQYRVSARAAVSAAFSLHDGIGVLEVVPASVAERAGLLPGDEILALNGESVEDPAAAASAPQSYRRLGLFSDALAGALRSGPASLLVRRGSGLLHLDIAGQPACGGEALVIVSSDANAWSDGKRVFVSTAMMQLAPGDDGLAFVVGHEMAHNILGHSSAADAHGLLGLFGMGASKVRREEAAADALAVPLMSAGGFAPASAIGVLETIRRLRWWDISIDHPGFGQRIRIVAEAIARMSPARS